VQIRIKELQKVAMLLDHTGSYDNRVKREAMTLKSHGYDVKIFCISRAGLPLPNLKDRKLFIQCPYDETRTIPVLSALSHGLKNRASRSNGKISTINSHHKSRQATRETGRLKRILGTLFSFQAIHTTLKFNVIEFNPDYIHAHDLSTLPSGSKLAQKLEAKLVYDSHEYEASRNIPTSYLEKTFRRWVEKKYIRKTDATITVSDSIADALARDYNIERPTVIWNRAPSSPKQQSHFSRKSLGLPEQQTIGLYIGAFLPNRGVEQSLEALKNLPNVHLAAIGYATRERKRQLLQIAQDSGVEKRFHILTPIDASQLISLIKVFDFTLIPIQNICESYNLSLPNKLFLSLDANVPIISTPLKELGKFMTFFNTGIVANGFDEAALANAIKSLPQWSRPDLTSTQKSLLQAYTWENASKRLVKIYNALENGMKVPKYSPLPHQQNINIPSKSEVVDLDSGKKK